MHHDHFRGFPGLSGFEKPEDPDRAIEDAIGAAEEDQASSAPKP